MHFVVTYLQLVLSYECKQNYSPLKNNDKWN